MWVPHTKEIQRGPSKRLYRRWPGETGKPICLDSRCGNARPGDCGAGGIETYPCCSQAQAAPPSAAQACACNQMWRLLPVAAARNGAGPEDEAKAVTVTNGRADAGAPDCHRTQGCLAVC